MTNTKVYWRKNKQKNPYTLKILMVIFRKFLTLVENSQSFDIFIKKASKNYFKPLSKKIPQKKKNIGFSIN